MLMGGIPEIERTIQMYIKRFNVVRKVPILFRWVGKPLYRLDKAIFLTFFEPLPKLWFGFLQP